MTEQQANRMDLDLLAAQFEKAKVKEENLMKMLSKIPDRSLPWEETGGIHVLPGPHKLKDKYPTKFQALKAAQTQSREGKNIMFAEKLALEFGKDTAINMTFPTVLFLKKDTYITDLVVVAHPKDAERIARFHVKKSLIYGDMSNFLGDGVLSTRNLDSWEEQRTNIVEGFLPLSSLAKIMPISVKRANFAVDEKLRAMASQPGKPPIDMCEFYLFEAMTQLHLALMGESTEFSEANNVKLRNAFHVMLVDGLAAGAERWIENRNFIREFSTQVLEHTRNDRGDPIKHGPFRAAMSGCPVFGPVSAKLAENTPTSATDPLSVQRDTAATISFAGFDTTALNMTWVTFEMCRRPELQARLQQEMDQVFDELNGRELQYEDLAKFKFLTKVINETLRLW